MRRFLGAAAICAAAGLWPFAATAANSVFTIGKYPVDATAQNAVAAKEKAHADGQQAAFGALLKRLVPVTAYTYLDRLKSFRAADFIDGVAIRSETNSSTQYIASLDVSFQADAVRNMLQREGVPFVEAQAPRMVLVPVTADVAAGGKPSFRPAGGTWGSVWNVLDLDNTLTPLRIEPLLPTVHSDTVASVLAGDDSAERILTQEYKADFVLFAVAEVDTAAKQLNVTLAGIDPAGLMSWRRTYRVPDGDVAYAMEFASVVTQGVLEGRWKVAKLEESGSSSGAFSTPGFGMDVHMTVEFSSLGEWNDLRSRILELPGVDDVRIGAVSARMAEVSVRYPGGGQGLVPVLARQGISLSGGAGQWVMRSGY